MTPQPEPTPGTGRRPLQFYGTLACVVVGLAILASATGLLVPHSTVSRWLPVQSPTGPGSLAMGTPNPGLNGSEHEYTISITPSDGLVVGNLSFWIHDSRGQNTTISGATVGLYGPTGCLVATFTISDQSWSAGPVTASNACHPPGTRGTIVTSAMVLVLTTGATNLQGAGDQFVVLVSGGAPVSVGLE